MENPQPIEYLPVNLGAILRHPLASKMLKDRDGITYAFCPQVGEIVWTEEGLVLNLYPQALNHAKRFPEHRVWLVENICNTYFQP